MLAVLVAIVWLGYGKYQANHHQSQQETTTADIGAEPMAGTSAQATSSRFTCDGRTMCSQMTSCAEATYFIQHCPNTKMDGNHDGVPCERQWCH